jgi:hypothetical protein
MILRLFSLFEIPKGDSYAIFKIYQICTFALSNTGLHPYLVHGTFDTKLHSVFEVLYTDNVNRIWINCDSGTRKIVYVLYRSYILYG